MSRHVDLSFAEAGDGTTGLGAPFGGRVVLEDFGGSFTE